MPVFKNSNQAFRQGMDGYRSGDFKSSVEAFEYAAAIENGKYLRELADYTLRRHDPELVSHPEPYDALLRAVIERQASLIVQWMHVGFIHGVMNTDNMALSGETIDYGPCAFMDRYSLSTVFSSSVNFWYSRTLLEGQLSFVVCVGMFGRRKRTDTSWDKDIQLGTLPVLCASR